MYENQLSKIIKFIVAIQLFCITQTAYSIATEIQFKAAQVPSLQFCTPGHNLLEREVSYQRTDIVGALPYTRRYKSSLGFDLNQGRDPVVRERTNLGWADNYQNFLQVSKQGVSDSSKVTIGLRLPEDNTTYYYFGNDSAIYRVFSANPQARLAALAANKSPDDYDLTGGAQSTEHRNFKLTVDTGSLSNAANFSTLSFSINRYGDIYHFKYVKQTASGRDGLFRIDSIRYLDGSALALRYDEYGYLISVGDNRNHSLTLFRDYVDAAQPAEITRAIVTKVVANINQPENLQQTATYNYTPIDWKNPFSNLTERFYRLDSVDSPLYSKEIYTYIKSGTHNFNTGATGSTWNLTPEYQLPFLQNVDLGYKSIQSWPGSYRNVAHWTFKSRNDLRANEQLLVFVGGGLSNGWRVFSDDSTGWLETSSARTDNYKTQFGLGSNYNLQYRTIETGKRNPIVKYKFTNNTCITYNGTPIKEYNVNGIFGYPTSVIDARGYKTEFTFDDKGRLTSIKEAVGQPEQRETIYKYTTLSNGQSNNFNIPNSVESPNSVITNTIDGKGWITKQIKSSPQSGSFSRGTSYYYFTDPTLPSYGLLEHVDGPKTDVDDTTSYTYDNFGNTTSERFYVGSAAKYTYYLNHNSVGQPKEIDYPNGLSDYLNYDNGFRLLEKKTKQTSGLQAEEKLYTYTYSAVGWLRYSKNPDGDFTSYDYDDFGNLIIMGNPDKGATTYEYNENGSIKKTDYYNTFYSGILSGLAYSTVNQLDVNGRIYRTQTGTDNTKNWVEKTFDTNGNVIQTKTALGIIEKWTYDALNRVLTHTDGLGNIDKKSYDGSDNLLTQTAVNSTGISARKFINTSWVTSETNNDYGAKSLTYNYAGNLQTKLHVSRSCNYGFINQLGQSDSLSCVDSSLNDANTSVMESYVYDPVHFASLKTVTSTNTGSPVVNGQKLGVDTSYSYDSFGRVISKTQNNSTQIKIWSYPATPKTVSYSYTLADKLQTLTLPSGNLISYSYTNGRMSQILLNNTSLVSQIKFDSAGNLTSVKLGPTQTIGSDYIYNDAEQLASISGVNNWSYTYDLDGRLTRKSDTGYSSGGTNYSYDANNQLTDSGLKETYLYDKNANRIRRKTYVSINRLGGKYVYTDTMTYTGNMLATWEYSSVQEGWSSGGTRPPYLVDHMPVSTTTGEIKKTVANGRAVHDALGRRIQTFDLRNRPTTDYFIYSYNHKNERTLRGGLGIDRQFVYDESSHLIGEYDFNGNMITEYIWMDNRPVAAIYPNNKIVHISTDHQKKPVAAIDLTTGLRVWSWYPDAYGDETPSGSIELNLRFPGQYYDKYTELYYNHNRYYNPKLGRYMEPDPIGLKGGLNPYAYAGNNPVMNVDPTGLCPMCAAYAYEFVVATAPTVGRYVLINAPRIGAFIEGLSPAAAGSVSSMAAHEIYTGSTLARNMANAGNPVTRGAEQAHHIVAQNAKAAQPARDILEKHGIGVNSAENGAAMLKADHQILHTDRYFRFVNRTLYDADKDGGGNAVQAALSGIQQGLQQQRETQQMMRDIQNASK